MPLSVKDLLLKNNAWYNYHSYYSEHGGIRDTVIKNITGLISCRHYARGHAEYCCINPECTHSKRVAFSCKSRACSSCGRMATERWIEKQKAILPPCEWQHVTMTMPAILWPFFNVDRSLLNKLCKVGANVLKKIASFKNVIPGLFMALHTFGRDLKWNTHLHISITRGGLDKDTHEWKSLFFKTKNVMRMWRYSVIRLLRRQWNAGLLIIPAEYNDEDINILFDKQYKKHWHVHCAKPHKNPKKDIEYLGRYLKRPAIANSRLVHYNGNDVLFSYLNHKTKKEQIRTCDIFEFIHRFTQHIPEKNFRMIRYYGFLSNALRGKLLPIVNQYFNNYNTLRKVTWQKLIQKTLGFNPLECIICHNALRFSGLAIGLSTLQFHYHFAALAQRKIIRPNYA